MVYINSKGQIVENRPWYSQIVEFFFGLINVFVLFFKTLWDPALTKHGSTANTDYRPNSRRPPGDGGGPPKKRIGGFGGVGNSPNCPPAGGGG